MESKTQPAANSHKKLALGLLIAPSGLLIVVFAIYALVNFSINQSTIDAAGPTSFNVISNLILFVFGLIGLLAWLPGVIIGIVLLSSQKKAI